MKHFLLLYLSLFSLCLQAELILIENGKILDDTFKQGKWLHADGKLKGNGPGNSLNSIKSIADGDFIFSAKLQIKELQSTASGLQLGGNLFGFDNRSGKFFLEGKDFPNLKMPKTASLIKSNEAFELTVQREDKTLRFMIDGKEVASFHFHSKKVSSFGFRPHRNSMEVSSLVFVEGKLVPAPVLDYVFACGEEGHKSYRIPSLIRTKKGSLLAFAEGRVHNWHDSGDINLVQKTSTDNGKTWSKLKIIRDIKQTAGNPCPIVDRKTGRIIMVFCEMDHHEHHVIQGKSKRRVFVMHSDDDGETWSEPKNITAQANPKDKYRWLASGPGVGIQIRKGKHKGRLVVPMANTIEHTYGVHTIYSDDLGQTWKASNQIEKGCNESQLVETKNGQLMLNMRMQSHGTGTRGLSYSKNGGKTWSKLQADDELNDPTCQASIIRYKGLLLFSNPATGGRNGMSIRISKNFGETWPIKKLIYPLSSAYSNLAISRDKHVLCLFEGGSTDYAHHGIALIRTPLKELLQGSKDK